MAFTTPLKSLSKRDIDWLIATPVPEGRTIEYKQALPSGTDDDKRKLLASVSSFANAGGGYIVFGIKDKRVGDEPSGIPETVLGLGQANLGKAQADMDQILSTGLQPRVTRVDYKIVDTDSGPVLVMQVPRSFNAPHAVKVKDWTFRFYTRTSSGKQPLDVPEIRAAFAASETLPERIRAFRAERLAMIIADDTPARMNDPRKVVLHVVPAAAFDTYARQSVDLSGALGDPQKWPALLGRITSGRRYNLDGLLGFDDRGAGKATGAYTQLFRHGAVEAASSLHFQRDAENRKFVMGLTLEMDIVNCLASLTARLQQLGVTPPLVLMFTLIGATGYRVLTPDAYYRHDGGEPLDRDVVVVPEVIVEDYPTQWPPVLKPLFDAIWQAGGWDGSPSYDEAGNWSPVPGRR